MHFPDNHDVSMHVYPCKFTSVGVIIHVCLASFEQNMCIVLHFTSTAIKKKDVSGNLLQCFYRSSFGLSVKKATRQTNFDKISCDSPRDAKIKVKLFCLMQNTECEKTYKPQQCSHAVNFSSDGLRRLARSEDLTLSFPVVTPA